MPNIKKINNTFDEGYIPNELLYTIQKVDIDLNKITYNDTYKLFEYHAKKMPYYQSIKGLDKVIQNIADNTLTPLEELKLKINSLNINNE